MDPTFAASSPSIPLLSPAAWWGALATLGVALLAGGLLLPKLAGWRRCDAWLLRAVAGLGTAALLVLLAGRIPGAIVRVPWSGLALAGWIWCGVSLARGWRETKPPVDGIEPPARFDGLMNRLGWILIAIWLAALLGPACCPPLNYDVLEYHMGIVTHSLRVQSVQPIPHVFYSAQPMGTEMLYLLAELTGGGRDGSFGGGLGGASGRVQWLTIVLATLVWWRLSVAIAMPMAVRPWLWLFLLVDQTVFKLQLDRMTDWAGVLMLVAGFWVAAQERALRNAGGPVSSRHGPMILGLLAAGALGAKWTHAGTVVPALALLSVWAAAGPSGQRRRWQAGLPPPAVFCGVLLIFFSPWPLWLLKATGNPFAPFLAARFPSEAWNGERLAFLMHTHGAVSPLGAEYWIGLGRQLTVGFRTTQLAIVGITAGAASLLLARLQTHEPKKRAESVQDALPVGSLMLALALGILLWGRLQHAADRFLAPLLLLGIVLLGLLLTRMERPRLRLVAAAALAVAVLLNYPLRLSAIGRIGFWTHAVGRIDRVAYLERNLGLTAKIYSEVNRLPAGARVLAVNEARGAYFARSVDLASVFDRQPIRPILARAQDELDLERRLISAGYTHLLSNEFEEARLLAFHPPVALEADPGFAKLRRTWGNPDPRVHRAAERALVTAWPGRAAFAAEPLSDRERRIYLRFMEKMRARATWLLGYSAPSLPAGAYVPPPAVWIAPLAEP
jgi:hypothetical protein